MFEIPDATADTCSSFSMTMCQLRVVRRLVPAVGGELVGPNRTVMGINRATKSLEFRQQVACRSLSAWICGNPLENTACLRGQDHQPALDRIDVSLQQLQHEPSPLNYWVASGIPTVERLAHPWF